LWPARHLGSPTWSVLDRWKTAQGSAGAYPIGDLHPSVEFRLCQIDYGRSRDVSQEMALGVIGRDDGGRHVVRSKSRRSSAASSMLRRRLHPFHEVGLAQKQYGIGTGANFGGGDAPSGRVRIPARAR